MNIHIAPVMESSIDQPEWHETGEYVLAGDPADVAAFHRAHLDLVAVNETHGSSHGAPYRSYPIKDRARVQALLDREVITEHNDEGDWLRCICGNEPHLDGFYTSFADGTYANIGPYGTPEVRAAWNGLVTCFVCGRVIDSEDWAVVATATPATLTAAVAAQEAEFSDTVARQ